MSQAPRGPDPLHNPPRFPPFMDVLLRVALWMFVLRAVLGIGFTVSLALALGWSIWVGLAVGCGVAFCAAYAEGK